MPQFLVNVSAGSVYWTVQTSNGYASSVSAVGNFFFQGCTDTTPDVLQRRKWFFLISQIPVLYSPNNGTLVVGENVTLEWTKLLRSDIAVLHLKFHSFGTWCENKSFVPYYKVFLSTSPLPATLIGVVPGSEDSPSVSKSQMAAGTWYWMICAFNGRNLTCSYVWQFIVCHPNTLGNPILSPSAGAVLVNYILLSWTIQC